jgi:hypothetical protein
MDHDGHRPVVDQDKARRGSSSELAPCGRSGVRNLAVRARGAREGCGDPHWRRTEWWGGTILPVTGHKMAARNLPMRRCFGCE